MKHPCPCTSGKPYALCCEPFHRGEREAPDAPALMRSRYSAFALARVDYLWRTLAAGHPDRAQPEAAVLAALRSSCRTMRYPGLRVLDDAAPDARGVARVLFLARLFQRGVEHSFLECSDFVHDGVGWRYLSGAPLPLAKLGAGVALESLRCQDFPSPT